ncbi:MAG: hypothetical protein GF410_01330 [Chitinivibrionales bacterium]|nr:hypothetical protein [Chitinivibrionales bacterium]
MVPRGLRIWFVIHFAADILLALPLLCAPVRTLSLLGWSTIDPFGTRLVGAALMGIGLESLLGRNASAEVFRAMLNLKIIWSLGAITGIALSLAGGAPAMGWVFLAVFCVFSLTWIYYRMRLRPTDTRESIGSDD